MILISEESCLKPFAVLLRNKAVGFSTKGSKMILISEEVLLKTLIKADSALANVYYLPVPTEFSQLVK